MPMAILLRPYRPHDASTTLKIFLDAVTVGQGVGSVLLEWAIATGRKWGIARLTAHASITARTVFATHGFEVVETCSPVIRGTALNNFLMVKDLSVPLS